MSRKLARRLQRFAAWDVTIPFKTRAWRVGLNDFRTCLQSGKRQPTRLYGRSMHVTELPDTLDQLVMQSQPPRTPGLHLSDVIKSILRVTEPGKYRAYDNQPIDMTYCDPGFTWERALENAWMARMDAGELFRPPEFELDGILMSPDYIDLTIDELVECKMTEMNMDGFPNETKFRKWIWQTGAYSHACHLKSVRFHVLWLRGDYKKVRRAYKVYRITWEEGETARIWKMLVDHARQVGLIVQTPAGLVAAAKLPLGDSSVNDPIDEQPDINDPELDAFIAAEVARRPATGARAQSVSTRRTSSWSRRCCLGLLAKVADARPEVAAVRNAVRHPPRLPHAGRTHPEPAAAGRIRAEQVRNPQHAADGEGERGRSSGRRWSRWRSTRWQKGRWCSDESSTVGGSAQLRVLPARQSPHLHRGRVRGRLRDVRATSTCGCWAIPMLEAATAFMEETGVKWAPGKSSESGAVDWAPRWTLTRMQPRSSRRR
jgi:hypothetical protein